MDSEIAEQILEELVPTFQRLEAESTAIVQFLKAKSMANDDELAPFLEQAQNASSVRWRAIRVRMARLLTAAAKSAGKTKEQEKPKAEEQQKTKPEEQQTEQEKPKTEERAATDQKKAAEGSEKPAEDAQHATDKNAEQPAGKSSAPERDATATKEKTGEGTDADQHTRRADEQVASNNQDRNVRHENEKDRPAESRHSETAQKGSDQSADRKSEPPAKHTDRKPPETEKSDGGKTEKVRQTKHP